MATTRIPSVEGGIQPTLLTTKGDLISATAASTVARLGVGSDAQILVADSTASTGLAYKGIGVANGLTTTGDTIYSSSGTTQSRLGIGSTGQVLTVASGVPSWATPASGSFTTAVNNVATQQATTSTSYTDLATVGATVTITTGTKALVSIVGQLAKTGSATPVSKISFAISGATTLSAADNPYSLQFEMTNAVGGAFQFGGSWIVTGLTAGSNVFTMKFKDAGGGTSYFANRTISVVDLGS